MRGLFVGLAFLTSAAMPAYAAQPQPAPETPGICWLAGMAFSPGATVRATEGVATCTPTGIWKTSATAFAAGCFRDGTLFAVGSTVAVDGVKGGKQICNRDGAWRS